jgi:sugar O-acyltransferase (sialic acid O-acetyltransferase NeuD family)
MVMNMKSLVLVGSGSFGRELYSWMSTSGFISQFQEVFFIDDNQNSLQHYSDLPEVRSTIQNFEPNSDQSCILAIAEPHMKKIISKQLTMKNVTWSSFLHPTAIIGNSNTLGKGIIMCPYSVISCNTVISDFVSLNVSATVGHDVAIGKYSTLSSHTDIMGFATLGEGIFVGSHGTVFPGCMVGDYAKIGVSSAAIRKVEKNTTVLGVPAKVIS